MGRSTDEMQSRLSAFLLFVQLLLLDYIYCYILIIAVCSLFLLFTDHIYYSSITQFFVLISIVIMNVVLILISC